MGLRMFLKVMLTHWWIIALTVAVTTASTAFFTARQKPVYRASTVLELKASQTIDDPRIVVTVMNSLDNRSIINTIARKAGSGAIQDRVAKRLGVEPTLIGGADVTPIVLPQANLIEIRAESTNPDFAAVVSNATAQELLSEARSGVFDIEIIDEAIPSTTAIGRSMAYMLTIGMLSGLVLGVGLALLSYLLQQTQLGSREVAVAAD